MQPKVIKACAARVFMEGPEICHEYFNTGKITFGTSTLLPGQTGAVDPGHPQSHEVFFVSEGKVILHVPGENKYFELTKGDAILIPEGVPHQLTNIGTEVAVVAWSCAPSP